MAAEDFRLHGINHYALAQRYDEDAGLQEPTIIVRTYNDGDLLCVNQPGVCDDGINLQASEVERFVKLLRQAAREGKTT